VLLRLFDVLPLRSFSHHLTGRHVFLMSMPDGICAHAMETSANMTTETATCSQWAASQFNVDI
jgi:hypothetical protein